MLQIGETVNGKLRHARPARNALLTLVGIGLAVTMLLFGGSPASAATTRPAHDQRVAAVSTQPGAPEAGVLAGGWGYVSQGNLRRDPNLNAQIIVTIYNQWVNILCWIDGGPNGFGSNRWFKTQYFDLQGYLSSGVVSSQPVVGHC